MRIHSLQHVAFEDLGSMKQALSAEGHAITTTHWYKGEQAPALNTFDLLIVMGGPMGVYDHHEYEWLIPEKEFLTSCIATGKKIIGICLGAQLISCVLGAKITRNVHREIGWFPLTINHDTTEKPISQILSQCSQVFHWHGDTFELPKNAMLIASSEACAHQAYVINKQIYAFQFHLETTHTSAMALIHHCAEDLDNSLYVQSAEKILADQQKFTAINEAMRKILHEIIQSD